MPMLLPAKTNATYDDVVAAPPSVRAEILNGSLYLQPRPRGSHQLAAGELVAQLRAYGRQASWVFLPEVEVHLRGDVLVPDITGWRLERFDESLDKVGFTTVPDWVCEVLSPSTRRYDAGEKRLKYQLAGVPALWEVDPQARTVEIYSLVADRYTWVGTVGDEDALSVWPFDGSHLTLAHLWGF